MSALGSCVTVLFNSDEPLEPVVSIPRNSEQAYIRLGGYAGDVVLILNNGQLEQLAEAIRVAQMELNAKRTDRE